MNQSKIHLDNSLSLGYIPSNNKITKNCEEDE